MGCRSERSGRRSSIDRVTSFFSAHAGARAGSRCAGFHLRQSARDGAARPHRRHARAARTEIRRLVRLQVQRAPGAGGGRRRAPRRTRTRLRAGRHRDDAGRVRGDRARARPGRRRRRRSHHPGARVVLLRPDAARGQPGPRRGGAGPDGLLARHRCDRARDHPAHTRRDRQLAVEPHRQGLPEGDLGRARGRAGARIPHPRAPDLAAVRRAVPAHPLRRDRLRQPGRLLSVDDDRLQLRQGPPRPRSATRLPRAVAAASGLRAGGAARRLHADPARDRLGLPQRAHAVQRAGAGERVDRHGGADPQARPALRRPQRRGIHAHSPGRHVLPVGRRPAATLRRTATRWPSEASTSCRARSSTAPSTSAISSPRRWR